MSNNLRYDQILRIYAIYAPCKAQTNIDAVPFDVKGVDYMRDAVLLCGDYSGGAQTHNAYQQDWWKVSKHAKFFDKFPEKKKAISLSSNIKLKYGYEKHHWSYNKEHYKDVIGLTKKEHNKAHRFLIYDQERMMYRGLDGVLLDTRERHFEYIMDKIQNEID